MPDGISNAIDYAYAKTIDDMVLDIQTASLVDVNEPFGVLNAIMGVNASIPTTSIAWTPGFLVNPVQRNFGFNPDHQCHFARTLFVLEADPEPPDPHTTCTTTTETTEAVHFASEFQRVNAPASASRKIVAPSFISVAPNHVQVSRRYPQIDTIFYQRFYSIDRPAKTLGSASNQGLSIYALSNQSFFNPTSVVPAQAWQKIHLFNLALCATQLVTIVQAKDTKNCVQSVIGVNKSRADNIVLDFQIGDNRLCWKGGTIMILSDYTMWLWIGSPPPKFALKINTNSNITSSNEDTLTAATGAVVPFHHTVVFEGGVSDVILCYAYYGIVTAVRWFAMLATPILLKGFQRHSDFKLHIVGHSLGDRTVALLTYVLQGQKVLSSTTCVPCPLDAGTTWELADSGNEFVTPVTCSDSTLQFVLLSIQLSFHRMVMLLSLLHEYSLEFSILILVHLGICPSRWYFLDDDSKPPDPCTTLISALMHSQANLHILALGVINGPISVVTSLLHNVYKWLLYTNSLEIPYFDWKPGLQYGLVGNLWADPKPHLLLVNALMTTFYSLPGVHAPIKQTFNTLTWVFRATHLVDVARCTVITVKWEAFRRDLMGHSLLCHITICSIADFTSNGFVDLNFGKFVTLLPLKETISDFPSRGLQTIHFSPVFDFSRVLIIFKHIQELLIGENEMQYRSIGWSVGATLCYAKATKDNHVIACIDDGSFLVTIQDILTMACVVSLSVLNHLFSHSQLIVPPHVHDMHDGLTPLCSYLMDLTSSEMPHPYMTYGNHTLPLFQISLDSEAQEVIVSDWERAIFRQLISYSLMVPCLCWLDKARKRRRRLGFRLVISIRCSSR
ncbi:putative pyruvate decarboxylase [Helianthus annuus]|nr:putative pyruvate decarboxylase [Helianthus annuus]